MALYLGVVWMHHGDECLVFKLGESGASVLFILM